MIYTTLSLVYYKQQLQEIITVLNLKMLWSMLWWSGALGEATPTMGSQVQIQAITPLQGKKNLSFLQSLELK